MKSAREQETGLQSIEVMTSPLPGIEVIPKDLTKGDRDFAGHGPKVNVYGYVTIRNTNELWATGFMSAEETTPDWTTVKGDNSEKIWDGSDVGVEEIVSVDSDTYTAASYTDTDHDTDSIWMGFDELVQKFVIVGDTIGDEAGSRTRMWAYFNPISLTVRKRDGPYSETVTPDPVVNVPEHVGSGDREFAGHGPDVTVWASINIQNTNELWATVSMYARETTADWTTATKVDGYKLWDGDDHDVEEITSIDSDTFTLDSYTDTDHAEDVLSQQSGELVDRFEVTGDTAGDDVGYGTSVEVYFNPIHLTVRY